MQRALKLAGKILLGTVGVLLVLLFVALGWPQLILNSKTAAAAVRSFGKSYRPEWKGLGLAVTSDGLLNKRVVFAADDFCLDEEHGALKGCFPRLKLDATLRLGFSPPVTVTRLETLVVRAGPLLRVDERPGEKAAAEAAAKKKKKEPASVPLALVPRPLRSMTVGLIDVDIPKAEILSSTGTTTASVKAGFYDQEKGPLTAEVYAVVQGSAPAVVSHYRANASLDTDLFRKGRVSSLDARATVTGDAGLKADVSAVAREPRPGELSLTARADATASGRTARARLDGLFSDRRATATATIALEDPKGPLQRAAVEDCRFDAPLGKKGVESADLKCAIVLTPKDFWPKTSRPKPLRGGLDFHADFKSRPTQADRFTARLGVELGPEKTWYGFFARLKVELAGRTGSLPKSLTAKHEFRTGFTIDRFEDLVAGVAHSELAIPAPLDSMKGKVAFSAHTAGDSRGESQKVDYEAKTALASPKQRLVVEVKGALTLIDLFTPDRRVKDDTDVDLKDVALELPYMKLGPIPRPIADKRIKTGEPSRDAAAEAKRPQAVKSTSTAVAFTVQVRTEKPVRLITNLIKDQIPVSLDLKATAPGLDGKIKVEPFDLQVFRQTARVDHITLSPQAGAESIPIDGKVVYKKNDVVVNILLLGSTDKPVVSFESTPPMNQNEIVALLLYGKSPAELTSDQQASAGTASSGFASGAFGLASLYLFASTPIDSVSYDPASKSYEVKFKLPGGATLGVGSDLEESKMLTLRKRVAKNIELETQLKTSQQQGNAVTTFLEWFRRY